MGHLQCTATLLGRSGQVYSFAALPCCKAVVGSVTPSLHRHTAREQRAVGLLLCTAILLESSGPWDSLVFLEARV